MKKVQLGSTDLQVSEVGFGGIPIIRLPEGEAAAVLQRAYDKGINFYDTANAYRDSEGKMGTALAGVRSKIILASKTMKRDGAGALEQLENSLRALRTDYIDLYQLHQVAQQKDWDAVTAPGGALEAAQKAKEQGKIRYIGISSHSLPMAIKLVNSGLFSTIQFPFNFIETAAQQELFPAAVKAGMGIIGMKPFAGGVIDNAAVAFKYIRQFPDVIPNPGFDSIQSVDEITDFYENANTVTDQDLAIMEKYRQELGSQFCRRCEYCQPCPQGVMITPAMGYRIVASRMSPKVAVEFSRIPMETVSKCVKCGICINRCPYDLPIPDLLQRNHELFAEHCK